MRKTLALLAAGISASALCQDEAAMHSGSLFSQGKSKTLFISRNAHAKGDILTILINEASNGTYTASTTTTKKDANSTAQSVLPLLSYVTGPILGKLFGSAATNLANAATGANSTGASSSVVGSGTTTSVGNYTNKITVIVKEVLPNGNLVIEGQRWLKMNKDSQSLVLSGVVRPDDVGFDNTLTSEKIADARIYAEGKGAIAERQRKGILTRIMEWLF